MAEALNMCQRMAAASSDKPHALDYASCGIAEDAVARGREEQDLGSDEEEWIQPQKWCGQSV
eukprot:CAMPEP_0172769752 /NCGR_PEP_ID=MMETSP1074-20121228/187229_1 /TAXON_ID=2916 /ORGANISM="Ceratium fusus, Strain PA161109" /LENGTH=61 /DNA_ID=CAMNT_0013605383 /DNA_START=821 /DNA_END=1005 /DNA_ORIENTATION=+